MSSADSISLPYDDQNYKCDGAVGDKLCVYGNASTGQCQIRATAGGVAFIGVSRKPGADKDNIIVRKKGSVRVLGYGVIAADKELYHNGSGYVRQIPENATEQEYRVVGISESAITTTGQVLKMTIKDNYPISQ